MPQDVSDQDIRRSLARAFDRAWDGYYRSGPLTISHDVARTELARRLVQLSKAGVRDEGSLAIAGLSYLRQLTTPRGSFFAKVDLRPLTSSAASRKLEKPWGPVSRHDRRLDTR